MQLFTWNHVSHENSTSSFLSLKTASKWVSSCLDHHETCKQAVAPDTTQWLPTRLIDLGLSDSLHWQLRITAHFHNNNNPVRYLALSYRWGTSPRLLLVHSTLERYKSGSEAIAELPRTSRHLVAIARLLSIRYVWIDALCIVQDSPQDWEHEALRMRYVYANAVCTVAASASSDEEGGLFRSRSPEAIVPGIANLNLAGETRRYLIFGRNYWDSHLFTGPLHTRGWVFQERHLSRRILYFTKHQIMWECSVEAKCEGFPYGIPYYVSDKEAESLWVSSSHQRPPASQMKEVPPQMLQQIYLMWCNLVKAYSQCSFTKLDDKLIAFSGIAKLFKETTRDEYLAGLWRSRLVEGLDWRADNPVREVIGPYRAPSWSWISVSGPVYPDSGGCLSSPLVEVQEVNMRLSTKDKCGPVLGGYLSVKGSIITSTWSSQGEDENCVLEIGEQVQARLYYDRLEDALKEGDTVECLPLHSTFHDPETVEWVEVAFLLIAPVPNCGSKAYKSWLLRIV